MPMNPSRLWAKSKRDDEAEVASMFLPGHLADVYHAAEKVLDATAGDQLTALGLKESEYLDRFRRCVLLAAAVRDLGKANDHFQGMICRTKDRKDRHQGIRGTLHGRHEEKNLQRHRHDVSGGRVRRVTRSQRMRRHRS